MAGPKGAVLDMLGVVLGGKGNNLTFVINCNLLNVLFLKFSFSCEYQMSVVVIFFRDVWYYSAQEHVTLWSVSRHQNTDLPEFQ